MTWFAKYRMIKVKIMKPKNEYLTFFLCFIIQLLFCFSWTFHMRIFYPQKHWLTCETQSLTDVVHGIPVKITAMLAQNISVHVHILIIKVYSQGQERAACRELCWNVRACVCRFGSKTKGNIGRWLSSSSVWTHKPLLCLLDTAASSSWAPCVIPEARVWCWHWMYRSLFMLRKGWLV